MLRVVLQFWSGNTSTTAPLWVQLCLTFLRLLYPESETESVGQTTLPTTYYASYSTTDQYRKTPRSYLFGGYTAVAAVYSYYGTQ